jgi:O-antigen ligase
MKHLDRAAWLLLCLFVFSIPGEKTLYLGTFGTVSRGLGIAAFAAGALSVAVSRSVRRLNLALLTAALLTVWVCLTWFWSIDQDATVARSLTFIQLLGMFWLIWQLCRGPARQEQLMQAYVWGSLVGAGSAFLRYAGNIQTYYRRYAAPGFEPNDFGIVMALSIPMAAWLALRAADWKRWLFYGAIVVQVAAVLLTASRTALIATFLAFGFLLLTLRGASRRHRVAVAVLTAFLLTSLVRLAPPASRKRLATIPTEVTRGTLNKRTQIWKSGLKAFRNHPVLGVGAGAYPAAVRPWLGDPTVPGAKNVAHNTFLSVLVECGIPGFALFALLLGCIVFFAWQMPSAERVLWGTMLLVWTAGVSTLTWEQYKPTWLLFALASTEWARSHWPGGRRAA